MSEQPHTHDDGTSHDDGEPAVVRQPPEPPRVSSDKVIHRLAKSQADDLANYKVQTAILAEQNEVMLYEREEWLAEREQLFSTIKQLNEQLEVVTMERDMLRAPDREKADEKR